MPGVAEGGAGGRHVWFSGVTGGGGTPGQEGSAVLFPLRLRPLRPCPLRP